MQVFTAVKKHALARGHLACLGEVATLNTARGCPAHCLFCHARCLPGAPMGKGSVYLYRDLPGMLRHELDNVRRRRPLPGFVLFNTASDAFLGGPALAEVSRACLEILLRRNIGVAISTRGRIPDAAFDLFVAHAHLVCVTIPIPSLSLDYAATWEPETLSPEARLHQVQKLTAHGIAVRVRLGPIIPFVNDQTAQIRRLASALAAIDVTSATLTFFHLRPGVEEQLRREAPPEAQRLILACFASSETGERPPFEHLRDRVGLAALRRIQRAAREKGLRIIACRCENPGLPAAACGLSPTPLPQATQKQAMLFDPVDLGLTKDDNPTH